MQIRPESPGASEPRRQLRWLLRGLSTFMLERPRCDVRMPTVEIFRRIVPGVRDPGGGVVPSNMSAQYLSDTETSPLTLLLFPWHVCIFVVAMRSVTRIDHRQALLPCPRRAQKRPRALHAPRRACPSALRAAMAGLRLQGGHCVYRFSIEPRQTASALR